MTEAAAWCRWKFQQETKKMTNENVNKWKCDLLLEDIKKMTWQIRQHSHWAYLLLMDTRKSLGVDEKSSKLAMTNCFTWMGSQSSIMNLSIRERVEKNRKLGLRGEKKRIDSFVDRRDATYQILLLQGFSMYKSIFSFNMAEVLCIEQRSMSWICHCVNIQQERQILWFHGEWKT